MKENKSSREKVFDGIIFFMMIIAAVFAIVQTALGNSQEMFFKLVLGLWILAAVVLSDFVEPYVNRKFDDMTEKSVKYYIMYAVTDGAMYAFAYVFIINITLLKEPVHYIFLALFVLMFVAKTIFSKAYKSEGKDETPPDMPDKAEELPDSVKELLSDDSDDDYEEESLDEEDILKIIRYRERKNEK